MIVIDVIAISRKQSTLVKLLLFLIWSSRPVETKKEKDRSSFHLI
jgi:hypothetical protein